MLIIICLSGLTAGGAAAASYLRTAARSRRSWMYGAKIILVSVCAALSAGFCAFRLESLGTGMQKTVKVLAAFPVCLAAAVIDAEENRIPDRLVLLLPAVRLFLVPLDCFGFGWAQGLKLLLWSFFSGTFLFLILILLSCLSKGGFGMGDVKLLSAVGFSAGFYTALYSLAAGLLLSASAAAVLLILRKKKLKDRIAFAPFLFLGLLISCCLGKV